MANDTSIELRITAYVLGLTNRTEKAYAASFAHWLFEGDPTGTGTGPENRSRELTRAEYAELVAAESGKGIRASRKATIRKEILALLGVN